MLFRIICKRNVLLFCIMNIIKMLKNLNIYIYIIIVHLEDNICIISMFHPIGTFYNLVTGYMYNGCVCVCVFCSDNLYER